MARRKKLGELLVESGVIDDFQLRSALGEQKRWGRRLGITLIKMGFLEEAELVRALATQLDLPVAHLAGKRIHQEVLDLVSPELAEKHMCLPLFVKEEGGVQTLYVGLEDPCDLTAIDDLTFRTDMRVKPVLVGPSELCEAIDRFYLGRGQRAVAPVSEPRPSDPARPAPRRAEPSPPPPEPEPDREAQAPDVAPDPGDTAPLHERVPAEDDDEGEAAAGSDGRTALDPQARLALQAMTQLLVEKGLLDPDEIQERVRRLRAAALDAQD